MAAKRPQLLTFNEPSAMRINRDLAEEIGLNESILLLQIEYLIAIAAHEREGKLWTYQSLAELHEIFPWWSPATISRTIKSLQGKELICVGNFNKKAYDRTQWYSLNPVGIDKLHSIAISQNAKWEVADTDAISQNDKWTFQNEKSILQNDDMDHVKMQNGSHQNETTIPKTSAKTSSEKVVEEQNKGGEETRDPVRAAATALCEIPYSAKGKQEQPMADLVAFFHEQQATPSTVSGFVGYWKSNANWIARNKRGAEIDAPYANQVAEHWQKYLTWLAAREKRQQQAVQPRQRTEPVPSAAEVAAGFRAMPTPDFVRHKQKRE